MPIKKQTSNVSGLSGIRWSAETAGLEFGAHAQTVRNRIVAEGIQSGPDGLYSTQQITGILFGDIHKQRLRRMTAEAEQKELRNRELKGEYLNTAELDRSLSEFLLALAQEIKGSHLSWDEQHSLLSQIADIPERLEERRKPAKK